MLLPVFILPSPRRGERGGGEGENHHHWSTMSGPPAVEESCQLKRRDAASTFQANFAQILDTPPCRTVKSGIRVHVKEWGLAPSWCCDGADVRMSREVPVPILSRRATSRSGEQIRGSSFFERVGVMNRRWFVGLASSVLGLLAVGALVTSSASVARAANGQKIEVVDHLAGKRAH